MESKNELKKTDIKNRTYLYFDDIMKAIDINFSDILLNEKSYENILIYDISYKTFMGANHCVLGSIKQIDLLKFMMELDIQYYWFIVGMMKFVIVLNIL